MGGYITFAGAHRLIDAGITGEKNLKEINKSSVMGIGIATIVRIFLFPRSAGRCGKGRDAGCRQSGSRCIPAGAGEIG